MRVGKEKGLGARERRKANRPGADRVREGRQAAGPAGQRAGTETGPSRGGPLLWQLSWASSGLCIILQKGSKLDLNFKPKKGFESNKSGKKDK